MFENYFHFHPYHDKQINDKYPDQDDNTNDYNIEYYYHDNQHHVVDNNELDDLKIKLNFSIYYPCCLPCSMPFAG
jgi:hypothetical protein